MRHDNVTLRGADELSALLIDDAIGPENALRLAINEMGFENVRRKRFRKRNGKERHLKRDFNTGITQTQFNFTAIRSSNCSRLASTTSVKISFQITS